jgi:hypothetical protein
MLCEDQAVVGRGLELDELWIQVRLERGDRRIGLRLLGVPIRAVDRLVL